MGKEVDEEVDKEMDMEVVHMEVDIGKDEEMDMEVKIQRNLGKKCKKRESAVWMVVGEVSSC